MISGDTQHLLSGATEEKLNEGEVFKTEEEGSLEEINETKCQIPKVAAKVMNNGKVRK